MPRRPPSPHLGSCAADSGTVGGSAHRRSTSSSRTSTFQFRKLVLLVEVYKVFLSGQGSVGEQIVEFLAVFSVFPQNRVQQRCLMLRNAFLSGLWSISLLVVTFLLVQVLIEFSQDRFQRRFLELVMVMMLMDLELCTVHPEVGAAVVGPQDSVPGQSSPARPVDASVADSSEWVQFRDVATGNAHYWNRRTNATAWKPPPGIKVVWVGERPEEGGIWYWHRAPVSVHLISLRCLLSEAHRGEGLGILHPGCHFWHHVRCLRVA